MSIGPDHRNSRILNVLDHFYPSYQAYERGFSLKLIWLHDSITCDELFIRIGWLGKT
jgi:hypothetical protein